MWLIILKKSKILSPITYSILNFNKNGSEKIEKIKNKGNTIWTIILTMDHGSIECSEWMSFD